MISQELGALKNEGDMITRENSNLASFEKRADLLSEDLRELQGKLGDLNTLVDRLNADADLEDIDRSYNQLQKKNQSENNILDDAFSSRQSSKMRKEYGAKKKENFLFVQDVSAKQQKLTQLRTKLESFSKDMKLESQKQKSLSLHHRRLELQTSLSDFEKETALEKNESGSAEKARLLEQVKENNQEIVAMEQKISDLEEDSRKLKEESATLSADTDTDKPKEERNAKFEELVKRDHDMQQFLDSYDSKMSECREKNQEVEKSIVQTLGRIKQDQGSGSLKFGAALKHQVGILFVFLIRHAESGSLYSELEKMKRLEDKIEGELRKLREKQNTIGKELRKVGNIESFKKNAETRKQRNLEDKQSLQKQREYLEAQITSLGLRNDAKKDSLLDNDTYNQLTSLEQKLRHHESNNYLLKDYIQAKKTESNYKISAVGVLKMAEDVNLQLQKIMSLPPAR
ncbi:MAG: hypothetical protein SGCHY_000849 [Lobulomycetales sp.]